MGGGSRAGDAGAVADTRSRSEAARKPRITGASLSGLSGPRDAPLYKSRRQGKGSLGGGAQGVPGAGREGGGRVLGA